MASSRQHPALIRASFVFFISTLPFISPLAWSQDFIPSEEDLLFLEEVQKKAFDYFLYEHDSSSGLVKDKADNFTRDSQTIASIAATGFGLSAMVVGAERGWISKEEAQSYCARTLRFFLNRMENQKGFFYHFVHWKSGKKANRSELSSIDTALLLAGALTAGEYFKGTEVETLTNQIYERVDFAWMLNGRKTLSMGWFPHQGFLNAHWDQYNESFILYLLAIASPTHPIPADSWQWVNKRMGIYGPWTLIYSPPLFTHQYSAVWVDFRNQNDGLADYFENSRIATLMNRQFCLASRDRYSTYSENIWGLTASLGPSGYRAYGSEPGGAVQDGTVAPTAAGSSIVFTPELSIRALKAMYDNHKDKVWGKYGFSDAFNLDRPWFAREVLGIDQGPLLLMIENFRSELIWKLFMRHPAVIRGMERIGFRAGRLQLKRPKRPLVVIPRRHSEIQVDGSLEEWPSLPHLKLDSRLHRELGEVTSAEDLEAKLFFAWDEDFLYVAADVTDESLFAQKKGAQIWKDDCLELYFDPEKNGLEWGSFRDIQLGLSPSEEGLGIRSWAWFQNLDPSEKGFVDARARRKGKGYQLEAKIAWPLLQISPSPGAFFGFSLAFHDKDQDGTEGKLNWFMLPDGKQRRIVLGQAVLEARRE